MRILFIADVRSPFAQGWIKQIASAGHDVLVVSSYPFGPSPMLDVPTKVVDITLAKLWNYQGHVPKDPRNGDRASRGAELLKRVRNTPASRRWALTIKELLMRSSLKGHLSEIRSIIRAFQPDIVHALRIPFEGIVAERAIAGDNIPLVVSTWGTDFTMIGATQASVARDMKQVLGRTDGLFTDCVRDLRLAKEWGFPSDRPNAVVPTSGGVDTAIFFPGPPSPALAQQLQLSAEARVIVNPRGFRNYVCQDAFFRALPEVIRRFPDLVVLAIGLRDFPSIGHLVDSLGIASHVRLLPALTHQVVGDVFRLASVSVSPSLHDGTPNSLLEAMATGCLPVAGDIESIREWIRDGRNGVLCDPRDPASQSQAIIRALSDEALRERARDINLTLVQTRAEQSAVTKTAEALYQNVASGKANNSVDR